MTETDTSLLHFVCAWDFRQVMIGVNKLFNFSQTFQRVVFGKDIVGPVLDQFVTSSARILPPTMSV